MKRKKSEINDVIQRQLDMMNQWLILKHKNINLADYLENKYTTVAVYGMGIYGQHLIRELMGTKLTVLYGIDIKEKAPYLGVLVYQLGKVPVEPSAVINTVFYDGNVEKLLKTKFGCPILSLEDIVFDSYR